MDLLLIKCPFLNLRLKAQSCTQTTTFSKVDNSVRVPPFLLSGFQLFQFVEDNFSSGEEVLV